MFFVVVKYHDGSFSGIIIHLYLGPSSSVALVVTVKGIISDALFTAFSTNCLFSGTQGTKLVATF